MPIFPSRAQLALCLLVSCLGTACGEDSGNAGRRAGAGGGAEGGTTAHPDASAAATSDAASGGSGLDAAQPAPVDAAQPAPVDSATPDHDAASPAVDGGPGAPASDAGGAAVDAAPSRPDAQAAEAGAGTSADSGTALPVDAGSPGTDAGGQPPAPDAGRPVEPVCIERGESCATGTCCQDSACVMDEQTGDARCVAPCEFPERCDDCGNYCGAEEGSISLHCSEPILLAKDGTYLGRASSNTSTPEGVCNPYSVYGNSSGTYSIHNKNGTYGSTFGVQSPYNVNNFDGPAIACPDEQLVIAYVNEAGGGFNDVDPDDLCDWLASRNFF